MKPALALALLALGACHQNLTMSDQSKLKPWERTTLFRNGRVVQAPPPGAVAREDETADVRTERPPMTLGLVERGRERFTIFCSACHGTTGDGDGMVVERGFPRPPNLHDPRLLAAPDEHFVDVITNGHGAMYSYADRVPRRDRWAITAYIRALQRTGAPAPQQEAGR